MTEAQLIDMVVGELTASCALPYSPPTAEIQRVIKLEKSWIYREYRDAVYTEYYILNKSYYNTPEWTNTRSYQMPNCVLAIKQAFEMKGGSRIFGINDPDLQFDRLMAADLYLTPLSSDSIAYRTIQWSFWDLSRAFNLTDIQHDFNINTHRFKVIGRDPTESLFVFTLNQIPDEELYDDPVFIKWVIAKCKISLARILGFFNYQLVGNVTINYADIRSEGKEELDELKEKIKTDSPADWFLLFN
jgi:hypothetical protein